ncbi:A-kinase anchor protein 9-like isoform X2 [Bradysia coprophila]|uniref:A-kinase anchor protein 9-like isoform X2 n=1 Tax=Bradysia coprophila TaxID=38358 RepID=UPI00187D9428|nr:A-kinase anchor protein 9-like isoform X2 [Bradysia coprophila]
MSTNFLRDEFTDILRKWAAKIFEKTVAVSSVKPPGPDWGNIGTRKIEHVFRRLFRYTENLEQKMACLQPTLTEFLVANFPKIKVSWEVDGSLNLVDYGVVYGLLTYFVCCRMEVELAMNEFKNMDDDHRSVVSRFFQQIVSANEHQLTKDDIVGFMEKSVLQTTHEPPENSMIEVVSRPHMTTAEELLNKLHAENRRILASLNTERDLWEFEKDEFQLLIENSNKEQERLNRLIRELKREIAETLNENHVEIETESKRLQLEVNEKSAVIDSQRDVIDSLRAKNEDLELEIERGIDFGHIEENKNWKTDQTSIQYDDIGIQTSIDVADQSQTTNNDLTPLEPETMNDIFFNDLHETVDQLNSIIKTLEDQLKSVKDQHAAEITEIEKKFNDKNEKVRLYKLSLKTEKKKVKDLTEDRNQQVNKKKVLARRVKVLVNDKRLLMDQKKQIAKELEEKICLYNYLKRYSDEHSVKNLLLEEVFRLQQIFARAMGLGRNSKDEFPEFTKTGPQKTIEMSAGASIIAAIACVVAIFASK